MRQRSARASRQIDVMTACPMLPLHCQDLAGHADPLRDSLWCTHE